MLMFRPMAQLQVKCDTAFMLQLSKADNSVEHLTLKNGQFFLFFFSLY